MLENYLLRGIVIGIVFGVPAGVVGILTIQRTLSHGKLAGLISGMGSSVADCLYASLGVFGITLISDFLLRHQKIIGIVGSILVILLGVGTLRKKGDTPAKKDTVNYGLPYFLSSFGVTITNPVAILSFMMVFTMFGITGNEGMSDSIQVVLGIFLGTGFWWVFIAVIVDKFRGKITDRIYGRLNVVFGILLIILGCVLGIRFLL